MLFKRQNKSLQKPNSKVILTTELLNELENYITENMKKYFNLPDDIEKNYIIHNLVADDMHKLNFMIENMETPFNKYLLKLIKKSGKTSVEIYKKANIDRKLFSKIKNKKDYQPSKNTAIAIALALELPIDDFNILLQRAGYSLSYAIKKDVIIIFFLEKEIYDIDTINLVLYEKNLDIL